MGKLVILIMVICFVILFPGFLLSEEEVVETETIIETQTTEEELPPVIKDYWQKEIEKLPPVERHYRLAQDYQARGKLEEAVKELNTALELDPEHVPSQCELGVIYLGQGDYDKSIEQLKKALELNPEYPKTHYALANAYARQPDPDARLARKHLDTAVKLGYHAVPWFVEYVNKLEAGTSIGTESVKE